MEEQATPLQVLFNVVLWCVIIYNSKKNVLSNKKNWIGWGLALLFCLYAFWGADYFHTKEIFHNYHPEFTRRHWEEVYCILFENLPNYFLFRLTVWGCMIGLIFQTFKRLDVPQNLGVYLFATFFLVISSYARASVGMAAVFFGFSFFVKPLNSKLYSYLCGILVMIGAIFLHKSIIVLVVLAPIAMLPLNKRLFIIYLLFVPLIIAFVNSSLFELVMGSDMYDEQAQNFYRLDQIGESKRNTFVLSGPAIATYIQYLAAYIPTFVFIRKFINSDNVKGTIIEKYMNYAVLICLISLPMYFSTLGQVIAYRYMIMALPPTFFAISKYVTLYGYNATIEKMVKFEILIWMYVLVYMLYCTIVAN